MVALAASTQKDVGSIPTFDIILFIIEGKGIRLIINKAKEIKGSFCFKPNDLILDSGSKLMVDEEPPASVGFSLNIVLIL